MRWRVKLSSSIFTIALDYQTRYDRWMLSIIDSNGETVIGGIRVVADVNLLNGITDARLMSGAITCVDSFGKGASPTRWSWRERHYLMFDDLSDPAVDEMITARVVQ